MSRKKLHIKRPDIEQREPKNDPRRAGLRPDERDPDEPPAPPGSAGGGVNMSGTPPEGGLAIGGMGDTNIGNGSLDGVDLADAYGDGLFDNVDDLDQIPREEADEIPLPPDDSAPQIPYGGPEGGAVGGTPAEKRISGGQIHRGLDPGNEESGRDSTLGSNTSGQQHRRPR